MFYRMNDIRVDMIVVIGSLSQLWSLGQDRKGCIWDNWNEDHDAARYEAALPRFNAIITTNITICCTTRLHHRVTIAGDISTRHQHLSPFLLTKPSFPSPFHQDNKTAGSPCRAC